MYTVRAQGGSTSTEKAPVDVAFAVALYMTGASTRDAAEVSGLNQSTLANILRRLDVIRSPAEANRQVKIDEGKTSLVARRRIMEREYTPHEVFFKREELRERFGVSRSVLDKDRKAIGYTLDRATARHLARWGSLKKYHQAQKRAVRLRRKGLTFEEVGEEIGCAEGTVHNLIDAWEKRKEDEDEARQMFWHHDKKKRSKR